MQHCWRCGRRLSLGRHPTRRGNTPFGYLGTPFSREEAENRRPMWHGSDPPLSSEEMESLLWMAQLGWRYDVPEEHFEVLLRAGYITKSIIDPVAPSGFRRLARESRRTKRLARESRRTKAASANSSGAVSGTTVPVAAAVGEVGHGVLKPPRK